MDSIRWECSKRRHMGCPFQIFTSLPENRAPIKALSMNKPEVHTCSSEKLTPLMHKFRLKLASRMQDDLDLSWTKIWNEERQLLLEEVKDQPGLLQQVILEMGDAELFRRNVLYHTVILHSKITPERPQITPDHTRSSQNHELGTDIFSLLGLTKQFSSL